MHDLLIPDGSVRQRFERAQPWPHLIIDEMMPRSARDALAEALAALPFRWRRVREAFYEHEVCNFIDLGARVGGPVRALVEELGSARVKLALADIVGAPDPRLEAVSGHRLYDGDSIGPHSDSGDGRSAFRLLLCAAPEVMFDGGALELHEPNGSGKRVGLVPYAPGRGFLFRLCTHSWHAVSPVRSQEGWHRFTVVATYDSARD